MKQKLLPLVIASLTTSGLAQADITPYGKINVSINNDSVETASGDSHTVSQNSNASRLGFKGDFTISETLQAIYKLEYEVNIDDGTTSTVFKQRNIYGGLQGNWGTAIVGNFNTPLKVIGKQIDQFNDYHMADIKNYAEGENREANLIQYTSPAYVGVTGVIAIQQGETTGRESLADGISAALQYQENGLTLAVAADSEVDKNTVASVRDTVRAVASYSFGNYEVGALWQDTELSNMKVNDAQDTVIVSGAMNITDTIKIKAQVGRTSEDKTNIDTTQLALGVDFKLSKSAKWYVYASNLETDTPTATLEADTIGAGLELKF
ncbi:MAG: putative porin [Bermanella sp.]|jgi:predicted porin